MYCELLLVRVSGNKFGMSSGATKRSHEEAAAAASSASKYPPPPPSTHEDTTRPTTINPTSIPNPTSSSSYPNPSKILPSSSSSSTGIAAVGVVSNPMDHHPSFDMTSDSRMPKLPRADSQTRDVATDKRSPLHSAPRFPPSSNEPHPHPDPHPAPPPPPPPPESRDSKDWRGHHLDNRDARSELRDLYHPEPKRDPHSSKPDRDPRFDARPDDTKELRHDRESHHTTDPPKIDMKLEKDASTSQLNWKESKDFQRGRRYSDSPGGHSDPWHMPRVNPQSSLEPPKDASAVEERDCSEAHEAVGENKVDLKAEDRYKDKDRKRKDLLKHREGGDRDKERSDRRGMIQAGNGSNDGKEPAREEREADRWEREKKDILKDRERMKEKDKDHTKRESWNGSEREGLHSEKEAGDGSARMPPEQENPPLEPKKQKDFDHWKNVEREAKDRRKERDNDTEGDRPEKRSRLFDKESDEGRADADGAVEREREVFNNGVQRRRMLRSRDLKSDKNGESPHNGPTLEVRIPAEHVTATNRQVTVVQLLLPLRRPSKSYVLLFEYYPHKIKGGGTIDLEPCLTHTIKYSISIVADKGLKKPLYTSARLKKGEVLYLETHSCRYELCFAGEKMVKSSQMHEETDKSHNHHIHPSNGDTEHILIDAFRWSRCKKPLPQKVMRAVGIPLPVEHVEYGYLLTLFSGILLFLKSTAGNQVF
ncbi:hypothetical protein Tsubulata_035705 [Turnera subulata]|uniref:Uncharacterized protein n=1 Tax=Turnera subulata TaxID=218843 RepID=A0A9Q0FE03_9ROSI|nr:hypothetical protein Tsubulata_035705 [Turnera subulata]